jgi:prepilin-type N-terminal cleavage/methylation domain-containing protein
MRSRYNSGYTLIEVLVTTAIVSILSVIGTNYYRGYIAKSRQLEAQTSLTAIYAALTTFYAENRSYTGCLYRIGYVAGTPASRLYWTGFNANPGTCGPGADQSCRQFEFARVHNAPLLFACREDSTPCCRSGACGPPYDPPENCRFACAPNSQNVAAQQCPVVLDAVRLCRDSSCNAGARINQNCPVVTNPGGLCWPGPNPVYQPSRDNFIAGAGGNISTTVNRLDIWTIDQAKNLINVRTGY